MEALQKIPQRFLRRLKTFQVLFSRLIGNMEVRDVSDSPFSQLPDQLGQETMKELRVFSHCRRMPSKYLLFLSIHHRHNLRCVFRSPLREQMRHLIILDTAIFTQIDPSLQLFKSKPVLPLLHFHINQLGRRTLKTNSRIQR